ncbi:bifunctional methylenetetrahydrofolate dehydrogenase/methenyltetrahydrofolate cyclohydrolase FolD [Caldinitratiruptor microaerophilus]|uniref:Bifunctional protein FolD n=1 Tax=Caldinitratiruptor microaerophilus TaxID=671077 RepID=A0AA35G7Z8_9FIRM|nr:bifunctional methylenetetrahydrofolate dehydrogenase/methenyltetrahydrofolate cyclohydrolase FolD [Caldinitratiruptor microaerophilus]BDG59883.1 bifunctional protein FolD [Caldinitratiruptor microaerophilus]
MPARIIDGKQIAADLRADLAREAAALRERGLVPGLTVILVGEDPASVIYTRNKQQVAAELGYKSELIRLPATTTQDELLELIARLNADPTVHGILIQSPLPPGLDEEFIFSQVHPDKDVDGFHPVNVGRLWTGQKGLVPCTPAGIMHMLRVTGIDPKGLRAVVVGRSNIVGKPMAALLLNAHATVTLCHSRTRDLPAVCREADILVAAVGRARMITADYVKPGAVVIDVGVNKVPGTKNKIVGDVDFEPVAEVAGHITPVPGGVGPMTIAQLMKNTLIAARRAWGLPEEG